MPKRRVKEGLLPCPFCKTVHLATMHTIRKPVWHYVLCPGCGAQGPTRRNEVRAIEAWNSRKVIDAASILKKVEQSLGETSDFAKAFPT